ncbi:MAG: hypothetical protein HZB49_17120 [Bradyrhizobium sp.]|nr:hypothetical protein [Bradyrhizobium sp.]
MTLVELLVVLALLSLLGGLVAAGLNSAAGSWQRVFHHNSNNEAVLATGRMLSQLLSEIVPQRIGGVSRGTVRFAGTSDRMEFLAPLAQRFGAADIVAYTLTLPGDGTFRVSWQLDRESPSGRKSYAPHGTEEVIEGISEGTFSYFGRGSDGGENRWRSDWQNRTGLPLLLRVRLTWGGRSEEIIAAPLLTSGPCSMPDSDLACPD